MSSFGGQQKNSDSQQGESSSSGLRKPREETINHLLNKNIASGGSQTKTFELSADAPAFVPRNLQSGYNPPVLSASAPEFVPCQQIQSYYSQPQYDFDPVLEEFRQTLMILNTQPGNVEVYMKPLCEKMALGVTKAEHMEEIIDTLFVKSTSEANFRYTGARICWHICSTLKDHSVFSSFRTALLIRCKKEYDRREHTVTNPDTVDILTGFTLFMGELFLNLEVSLPDGTMTKMEVLPGILQDLILTLLSQPSKPTIKCTCQLLKLVGANMEDMMRQANNSHLPFDEVFSQLQLILQSTALDETSRLLIKSVLNLRQSNWGRPESTSSQGDSDLNGTVPLELVQDEPVFYNASGQMISREEAGFFNEDLGVDVDENALYILNEEEEQEYFALQAEDPVYQMNDGSDMYGGTWSSSDDHGAYAEMYQNEEEMNDEEEAAYDEFLKLQGYH